MSSVSKNIDNESGGLILAARMQQCTLIDRSELHCMLIYRDICHYVDYVLFTFVSEFQVEIWN